MDLPNRLLWPVGFVRMVGSAPQRGVELTKDDKLIRYLRSHTRRGYAMHHLFAIACVATAALVADLSKEVYKKVRRRLATRIADKILPDERRKRATKPRKKR